MNIKQKIILIIGAIAIIVTVLFPTWSIKVDSKEVYTTRMSIYSKSTQVIRRYHPYERPEYYSRKAIAKPDYKRTVVEVIIVLTLVIVSILVLDSSNKKY